MLLPTSSLQRSGTRYLQVSAGAANNGVAPNGGDNGKAQGLDKGMTLQTFTAQSKDVGNSSLDTDEKVNGELLVLMGAIESVCKRIASLIRNSGLEETIYGYVEGDLKNAAGMSSCTKER